MGKKPPFQDNQLRELVTANVDVIVRKAQALACRVETDKVIRWRDNNKSQLMFSKKLFPLAISPLQQSDKDVNIPANQTILDMIAQAVNPLKLAQMDLAFMANF